jgi:hypothetical protein
MSEPIYALLIGINTYASPTVPNLGGCLNDVTALAALLRTHFAVPDKHIVLLRDTEATYDAVKSQFRQHLLGSVRAFVAAHPGDQPAVLFHFSGHGSQAPDPTGQEPDGFDETLVCHDSRLEGVYDLKDWELGQLIDEVAVYTDNITVILDCCHSGGGTRSDSKVVSNTRNCYADLRPQPHHRPLAQSFAPRTQRRGANHVLLAACRDQEKALETTPTAAQPRHGVLTHYLIPLLAALDVQQLPTYRELYERLQQTIVRGYPQTPQCEGDWGRLLFGGARPDRELWLTVIGEQGSDYLIDGGLAHGLVKGAKFHVYNPMARTLADAGTALGTLALTEVGAVQSICTVVDGARTVPLHARLAPVDGALAARRGVAVEIAAGMIATAVRERLAQSDLAGIVALQPMGSPAPLRLAYVDEALEIQDEAGRRIGKPYLLRELNRMRRPLRAGDLDPLAADLRRIVRAQRLDLLRNADSELADALQLTIRRLEVDGATGAVRPGATLAVMHAAAPVAAALPAIPLREPLILEIANLIDEGLYAGLLLRSGAWQISQLYPTMRGAQQQLFPKRTVTVGGGDQPADHFYLADYGIEPGEEITFLLIGTVAATDFEALLQEEKAVAAAEAARQAGQTQPRVMRSFKLGGAATVADEWMTLQLKARVVG